MNLNLNLNGDHVALSLLSRALSRHIEVISTVNVRQRHDGDMILKQIYMWTPCLHDKSYLVLGKTPELINYVSLCIDG